MHPGGNRSRGPDTWGKIGRDNVGKGLYSAGAHSNLQGLWIRANRQRDTEDIGLAHEFVEAKMTG